MPRRFAPRNDKLESLHVWRECLAICSCLRRSLSAATDRETSRKGMRSPVYLAIKRNAPKLESLGAFIELLSRFELESTSRGAGSAGARNDLGLKCASRKGMRSPVLPTVKEKPSKPEGFEGFWSCYPDSNWSPCPAEQAPREPGATSDQNALRARG